MKPNKILYIDDSLENGMTAMAVDSRIDFASGLEQIERPLGEYDCIITDMQMQHAESGFEVVERALKEGKLPYIATGGTYEHGGSFNRVRVFNSDLIKTFDRMSKTEERFWRQAIQFIDKNPESATQQALKNVRETLGSVPREQVGMLIRFYRENYKDEK